MALLASTKMLAAATRCPNSPASDVELAGES